jgi:hypothetical protein
VTNCRATSSAVGSARRYGTACLRVVSRSLAKARVVVTKIRVQVNMRVQRIRCHRCPRRTITRAGPAAGEPHLNFSSFRLAQNTRTCVLSFFAFGGD